jgi:hypothetical protein
MGYNATVVEASDLGLAAWSLDPAACIVSATIATTVQYLASIFYKPEPDVAPLPSKIIFPNGIVASSSAFQVGLINQDQIGANAPGTLLASSPAAGTLSAGLNLFTLTYIAAAPAALPQGRYWIAIVNTTTGATTGLASSNPGAANLGVNMGPNADVTHCRFGIASPTGALVNITPSLNVITNAAGLCLCAGLV